MERFLTTEDLGELFGIHPKTAAAWRIQGRGPRFLRISGGTIRYRQSDVEAWLRASVRRSTSDPGPDLESDAARRP